MRRLLLLSLLGGCTSFQGGPPVDATVDRTDRLTRTGLKPEVPRSAVGAPALRE